jgi:hypothetical protein
MFRFFDGIYGINRITTPDTVFAEAMTRQASPGQAPNTKHTKAVLVREIEKLWIVNGGRLNFSFSIFYFQFKRKNI